MRPSLILPCALLLGALVPVVPVGAETLPTCTVHFPSTVAAKAPSTPAYPTFTGCEGVARARWQLFDRAGTRRGVTIGIENGASLGPWYFRDSYPLGTYDVVPVTASTVQQNSPHTVVKLRSRISLKGYRKDDLTVPLTGIVSRYVPSAHAYQRWAYHSVSISYRDCNTCTWKYLATDKTDRNGVFGLSVISDVPRHYRARVGETSNTWGSTSAAVRY